MGKELPIKEVKKLSLMPLILWIIGLMIMVYGLANLDKSVFGGVIIFIAGIFVTPYASKWFIEKKNIQFSGPLKIVVVIILLTVGGVLSPQQSPVSSVAPINNLQDNPDSIQQVVVVSQSIPDTTNTFQVVLGDLQSMFPIRSDLPTEWVINPTEKINIIDDVNTLFKEGYAKVVSKDSAVNIRLVRFDSAEIASQYFNEKVNPIKEKGGYTEIDLKKYGQNCFAWKTENYLTELVEIRCAIKDVYLRIYSDTIYKIGASGEQEFIANIVVPKVK